ncbi:unannotated protein [freshwater metagenome]|uniref:Unannotated protein n=1 Tax=freshwater metagenome TaxID=449393 RepID=A0A6J6K9K5_9ZZZZ
MGHQRHGPIVLVGRHHDRRCSQAPDERVNSLTAVFFSLADHPGPGSEKVAPCGHGSPALTASHRMSAHKPGHVGTGLGQTLVNARFDAGDINDCGCRKLLESAPGHLHRHVRRHGNDNQIWSWGTRWEGNTRPVVGGQSHRRGGRVSKRHHHVLISQGKSNTGTEQASTNDVNAPEGCISHRGHASAPRWKMCPDVPGSTHWTPPAY